ncbi:hypothetical protein [Mesorhizobium sp. KR1-2]|uniref:hypothetical protein n=1 Tax=Mesorhizobium sp. KR1-2 TaxID=3156609 RepID=UPI0032B48463
MAKKIHPADQADLDAIAQATHFVVHMRRGPADVFKQEAPTLAEAIVIAGQVRAENKGRDCLIYAITPEGNSIPVPKAMQRAIGGLQTADAGPGPQDPTAPASKPARARPKSRRAEIAENAAMGVLPPAPDFSAETHRRFRGKLAEIVKLIEAGDVAALKAIEIKTYSSSPKALDSFRNLTVMALEAAH